MTYFDLGLDNESFEEALSNRATQLRGDFDRQPGTETDYLCDKRQFGEPTPESPPTGAEIRTVPAIILPVVEPVSNTPMTLPEAIAHSKATAAYREEAQALSPDLIYEL